MQSLIPFNERDRLRALHACQILDTPDEECFDRITARAAAEFDIPTSVFSLLDSGRYWVKSSVGLGVKEMDRAVAICANVVASNSPLVLEDTHKDRRFVDHPLVKEAPFIRFYAGIPVRIDSGHAIGAFCIFDTAPRQLRWEEYLSLQSMAKEIEDALNNRNVNTTNARKFQ